MSLVIPTYNRSTVLCDTLDMALAQTYSPCEVIVVDQTAHIDRTVQSYIDAARDRIRYLHVPMPNLPRARNIGFRAATGDLLIFIDDDVRIEPDYIARHVRNYHDPSVGGVTGVLVDSFHQSARSHVIPDEALLEPTAATAALGTRCRQGRHRTLSAVASLAATDTLSVAWLNGGNTSYRRSAILAAGLWDERFGGTGWCEDADISLRIRHAGYTLLRDSKIELIHLAWASGGCRNEETSRARAAEHLQLYMFFMLKNRDLFAFPVVWRAFVDAYRTSTLNRVSLGSGPVELLRRHLVYGRCVIGAWRLLSVRVDAGEQPRIASATSRAFTAFYGS